MKLKFNQALGALLPVGILAAAATAVYVTRQARKAEREHPPIGEFIEVDGVRLHYVDRGEGPPVILLHGNGAMLEDWEISGILDETAQHHRVIAFDRPGFGHSGRPRTTVWTPDAQAELLWKAMERLGVERPVIVGHSWGTMVALAMGINHSKEIDRLVLLSGYYFPTPRPDAILGSPPAIPGVGDLMRYTVAPIMGKMFEQKAMEKIFAPSPVSERFAAEFPIDMSLRPSQIRASAADTALMVPGAMELSARYDELSVPTFIIAGTGDQIVDSQEQSSRLHSVLAGSRIELVEGAGHMVHYVAGPQIMKAIDGSGPIH